MAPDKALGMHGIEEGDVLLPPIDLISSLLK